MDRDLVVLRVTCRKLEPCSRRLPGSESEGAMPADVPRLWEQASKEPGDASLEGATRGRRIRR